MARGPLSVAILIRTPAKETDAAKQARLLKEAKAALARGTDVNAYNDNGRTALMVAVLENHIPILKLLLRQPKIEVNKTETETGNTALHFAVKNENIEATKLLLKDKRVNVNCITDGQMTPLLMASTDVDKVNIMKLLLETQTIDVNYAMHSHLPEDEDKNNGMTALMLASVFSNVEATNLLLEDQRVDVNQMTTLGYTALHMAPNQMSEAKFVELLLAHPRVDVNSKMCDPPGPTVLHIAADQSNAEVVKLILDDPRFTSANASAVTEIEGASYNCTAVGVAAVKGNWEILEELVRHPSIDLDVNHKPCGKDQLDLQNLIRYDKHFCVHF